MTRIVHCADLHLSVDELEYSFSVLSEIVALAKQEKADGLLFAGDTFNNFDDAEELRSRFRCLIDPLGKPTKVMILPGNHEDLRKGKGKLGSLDFGAATLLGEHLSVVDLPDVDIVAIPHRNNYADYREWPVPEKRKRFRVVTAHCVVSGLGLPFQEDEENVSVADPDMFRHLQADYAALGHIHSARIHEMDIGRTSPASLLTIAYPGSARVCRKGEAGPRCVNILEVDDNIGTKKVALKSAGEFREVPLDVSLDGALPGVESLLCKWGANDRLELTISGIVEDENKLKIVTEQLLASLKGKVRSANINRDGVSVLSDVASKQIVQKFLEYSGKLKPEPSGRDYLVWRRAREIGLGKLKKVLENRT